MTIFHFNDGVSGVTKTGSNAGFVFVTLDNSDFAAT
jgi:hypothetical protein